METDREPNGKVSTSGFTYEVVATGNASFAGRTGLTRLDFIDAGEPGESYAQYVGATAAGNVLQERFFGASQRMPSDGGTLTATTVSPEGEILDEYPEAAGLRWNALATETNDIAISAPAYHYGSTETIHNDGSSSYSLHTVAGANTSSGTRVLNSDGSVRIDSRQTGWYEGIETIGLPFLAGGRYFIPITTSGGNPLSDAAPAPAKTVDVPDWYPSHDLAPRPLVSASVVNEGRGSLPAVCGRIGSAFRLHLAYASLTPYGGTASKAFEDEYDVPGLGNVCTVETFADFYVPDDGIGGKGALLNSVTGVIVSTLTGESGPRPLLRDRASTPRVSGGLLHRFLQARRFARAHVVGRFDRTAVTR
jgi:hypothetical protein